MAPRLHHRRFEGREDLPRQLPCGGAWGGEKMPRAFSQEMLAPGAGSAAACPRSATQNATR